MAIKASSLKYHCNYLEIIESVAFSSPKSTESYSLKLNYLNKSCIFDKLYQSQNFVVIHENFTVIHNNFTFKKISSKAILL